MANPRKPTSKASSVGAEHSTTNNADSKPELTQAKENKASGPIRIVVTTQEKAAIDLAGNAPDDVGQIEDTIRLMLIAQNISRENADELAPELAKHAMEARSRIEEARRYVLVVRDP